MVPELRTKDPLEIEDWIKKNAEEIASILNRNHRFEGNGFSIITGQSWSGVGEVGKAPRYSPKTTHFIDNVSGKSLDVDESHALTAEEVIVFFRKILL